MQRPRLLFLLIESICLTAATIVCSYSTGQLQAQNLSGQSESTPRAWGKQDESSPSYFVPIGNRRWIEVGASGYTFSFGEVAATESGVELFDPSRRLKIRLGSEHAEIATEDEPYRRWHPGAWIAREKLPEFARLARIDYRVRLIYFVPTDRKPTRDYRAKIQCLVTFVNSFYRYELRRRGWDDRGLELELDEQGQTIVHLIQGSKPAAYYSGAPNYDANRQYERIQPEIPRSIGTPATHLMLAFMETYDEAPHHFEWPGGVALGGQFSPDGGLATFSAWILRAEFCAVSVSEQTKMFSDSTPIEGRTALGHGRPNSPRFEFIEDGFGAVIHEVGHALGLPHDLRDDQHYIMANGFRRLRVNLIQETPMQSRARFSDANANFLRFSRHLNPAIDRNDNDTPTISLEPENLSSRLPSAAAGTVNLRLKASDNRGLAAWRAFDPKSGSVLDGGELSSDKVDKPIQISLLDSMQGAIEIQVTVIDNSGNVANATIALKR